LAITGKDSMKIAAIDKEVGVLDRTWMEMTTEANGRLLWTPIIG
jgi:hypothetical protein